MAIMSERWEEDRAILHVDMDAFYAAVEVMDDPALSGKPVIVGGTPEGRGVVSAASYEARKFGVHSAMSAYRARKLCPDGVFVWPRMSRYAELSREIRAVFEQYTPIIEPISLDEAFLDVTGSQRLFGPPTRIGRAIKLRIREEVGLVASVGVAPNKYLAKLASDLEKPDGFVVIGSEEAGARLAPLPVSRLWGVGKKTQEALARMGIHLISDLLAMPDNKLEARVGVYANRLKNLARGVDDRPVVAGHEHKSISAETTFSHNIGDPDELRACLDQLVEKVAKRVRQHRFAAHTISIKARYPDFTTVTRALTLSEATAQSHTIREAARGLLENRLERERRPLRLLGVAASNLIRSEGTQALLFQDVRDAKEDKMDEVMDELQERFGSDVIHRGRGGRGAKTQWEE